MPNESQPIPAALAQHIQRQQDRAMLISVLLDTATTAIDAIDGTGDCTMVLRHINTLTQELVSSLDVVNLPKAVQS